jgi:hypothetical protein
MFDLINIIVRCYVISYALDFISRGYITILILTEEFNDTYPHMIYFDGKRIYFKKRIISFLSEIINIFVFEMYETIHKT